MKTEKEIKKEIKNAEEILEKLNKINCEPTSRLLPDGDDRTEWMSSIPCVDVDGIARVLCAYYFTSPEQDQTMADNDGDGSSIDWEIDGYDLI